MQFMDTMMKFLDEERESINPKIKPTAINSYFTQRIRKTETIEITDSEIQSEDICKEEVTKKFRFGWTN
jgi:hypothetical protein